MNNPQWAVYAHFPVCLKWVPALCRCVAHAAFPQWWTVGAMIQHLNDDHHWTREAIADWVDRVTPAARALPPVYDVSGLNPYKGTPGYNLEQ